jgi:hypothetical protein
MATLDQSGNVLSDRPLDELDEVKVTAPRPVAVNWSAIIAALVGAGILYALEDLTRPRRRRR